MSSRARRVLITLVPIIMFIVIVACINNGLGMLAELLMIMLIIGVTIYKLVTIVRRAFSMSLGQGRSDEDDIEEE